jgi:sialate O-acetylesterase
MNNEKSHFGMSVLLRCKLAGILFTIGVLICPRSRAIVKPAAIFSDNAVLQRGISIRVWGTARNSERVTVALNGQEAATIARDGKWMARLKPMTAGGPFRLIITGENRVELTNVCVGDVWLCSGQSNMQWPLSETENGEQFIAKSKDDGLRLFTVPLAVADAPASDLAGGDWRPCGPDSVGNFSAVAYHFGSKLRKALGVPIGLIDSSYGGSIVQAWTSMPYILSDQESSRYLGNLPTWAAGPQNGFSHLYNAMIAPIIPYGIRGVIWYQGEGNTESSEPQHYRTAFSLLIRNWRAAWGQGEFPFLFVQLPPWAKDDFFHVSVDPDATGWAVLRQSQLDTSRTVKHTAMVVTMDLGDEIRIHPRRKDPVGQRLALAALGVAYGQNVSYKGPIFKSFKVNGATAVLSFEKAPGGLVVHGNEITGLTVAGRDRKFYPAKAQITDKRKIKVWSEKVAKPAAVRYGWANYTVVNVFDESGLPLAPFRTDDWPAEKPFKTYPWPPPQSAEHTNAQSGKP